MRASAELQKSTGVPSYNTEKGDGSRIKRLQMIAGLQAIFLGEEGKDSFEGTLKSAKDFFSQWQTYPFCYGDIKDFVEKLPANAQADFLEHLAQSSKRMSKENGETQQTKVCPLYRIPGTACFVLTTENRDPNGSTPRLTR